MRDTAPDFIRNKLSELEQERKATDALIKEKERELAAMASSVISNDQLIEAIARVQSGADNYKLRSEIASQLQSIVTSLYVAMVGSAPLIKMAQDSEDEDVVIQFVADMPSTGRFFAVKFRNGSIRAVEPNPEDRSIIVILGSMTIGEPKCPDPTHHKINGKNSLMTSRKNYNWTGDPGFPTSILCS